MQGFHNFQTRFTSLSRAAIGILAVLGSVEIVQATVEADEFLFPRQALTKEGAKRYFDRIQQEAAKMTPSATDLADQRRNEINAKVVEKNQVIAQAEAAIATCAANEVCVRAAEKTQFEQIDRIHREITDLNAKFDRAKSKLESANTAREIVLFEATDVLLGALFFNELNTAIKAHPVSDIQIETPLLFQTARYKLGHYPLESNIPQVLYHDLVVLNSVPSSYLSSIDTRFATVGLYFRIGSELQVRRTFGLMLNKKVTLSRRLQLVREILEGTQSPSLGLNLELVLENMMFSRRTPRSLAETGKPYCGWILAESDANHNNWGGRARPLEDGGSACLVVTEQNITNLN